MTNLRSDMSREYYMIRRRYWKRVWKRIRMLYDRYEDALYRRSSESEYGIYSESLYYLKWKINKLRILMSLLSREVALCRPRAWLWYMLDYINFRAVWFTDAIKVPHQVHKLVEEYENDNNAKSMLIVWLGNTWRRYLGE